MTNMPPPIQPPYASQPSYAQSPYSSAESKRIAAGVCGILLGGFGVHKFILGYTTAGLIMLLISILSCGIFYPVMHIIGLIEGILYLTKSNEAFYHEYILQKKPWF